jgi:hypothetical protein
MQYIETYDGSPAMAVQSKNHAMLILSKSLAIVGWLELNASCSATGTRYHQLRPCCQAASTSQPEVLDPLHHSLSNTSSSS